MHIWSLIETCKISQTVVLVTPLSGVHLPGKFTDMTSQSYVANKHLPYFRRKEHCSLGPKRGGEWVCLLLTGRHPFNGLFSRTTWISKQQKG